MSSLAFAIADEHKTSNCRCHVSLFYAPLDGFAKKNRCPDFHAGYCMFALEKKETPISPSYRDSCQGTPDLFGCNIESATVIPPINVLVILML